MTNIQRYTDEPFPSYRYLPFRGDMPHPRNDPEGHSYGKEEDYLESFAPDDWPTCHPYLYGVDLFNYGYWWEAHDAWEAVWLAAGRDTQAGLFIQGLIQIAAGQLKRVLRDPAGIRVLTQSGLEKLSVAEGTFLGINIEEFKVSVLGSMVTKDADAPTIHLEFP
ncbi:MAG: hypothetical protein C0622_03335 [Desulfuromonas sp.]|nr:MAG: hypothetical protein C0622_03335 [Desulfuromonas sp.]